MRGRTKGRVKSDGDDDADSGLFCTEFAKQNLLLPCIGQEDGLEGEKFTNSSIVDNLGQYRPDRKQGESAYDASAEVKAYKNEIKAKLRQFDLNFQKQHGRMPTREEKEPVRHLYHIYKIFKEEATALDEEQQLKSSKADLEMYMSDIKEKLKKYDTEFMQQHGRMPTKQEKAPVRHLMKIYATFKAEAAAMDKGKHRAHAPVQSKRADKSVSHSGAGSRFSGSSAHTLAGASQSPLGKTANTPKEARKSDNIDKDVERWKEMSVSHTGPPGEQFTDSINEREILTKGHAKGGNHHSMTSYAQRSALASKRKDKKSKPKETVTWKKLPDTLKAIRPKKDAQISDSVGSSSSSFSRRGAKSARSPKSSKKDTPAESSHSNRGFKRNIPIAHGKETTDSHWESSDAANESGKSYKQESRSDPGESKQDHLKETQITCREGPIFF